MRMSQVMAFIICRVETLRSWFFQESVSFPSRLWFYVENHDFSLDPLFLFIKVIISYHGNCSALFTVRYEMLQMMSLIIPYIGFICLRLFQQSK